MSRRIAETPVIASERELHVKHDFWGNCYHIILTKDGKKWIIATELTEGLARQKRDRLARDLTEAFGVEVVVK